MTRRALHFGLIALLRVRLATCVEKQRLQSRVVPGAASIAVVCATTILFVCGAHGLPTLGQGSSVEISHIRTIPLRYSSTGIAWSQDGTRLAAIGNFGRTISIMDGNGDVLRTIQREETLGPYIGPIAFLRNSHLLLSAAPTDKNNPALQQNTFAIWNTDSGEVEKLIPGPSVEGDRLVNRPMLFDLSPDGSRVAVWPIAGAVTVYSTADWRIIFQKRIARADLALDYGNDTSPADTLQIVTSLAWSQKNLLAVGFANGVVLIDTLSAPPIVGFIPSVDSKNDGRLIKSLAFNSSENLLALGIFMAVVDAARQRAVESGQESDEQKNSLAYLKVFDTSARTFIAFDPNTGWPASLEWGPDGMLAVSTVDGHLRVYRPAESGGIPQADFALGARPSQVLFSSANNEWAILSYNSGISSIELFKIRYHQ